MKGKSVPFFKNLKDSVNKGWQITPLYLIFPVTNARNHFLIKKIYFLTAPAIAPPRKAIMARYKVITIYRKNPVPTAGM
jgi:hypothetical protein